MVEISGYGTGFRPVTPFIFGRLPGARHADSLVFARFEADGGANVLVVPGRHPPTGPLRLHRAGPGGLDTYRDAAPDGPQVLLGAGVADVADVAHPAGTASPDPGWSLRTDTYEIPWPTGTTVRSTHPGGPWPFELNLVDSDENAMLMLRGPFAQDSTVPPTELIAPGQALVDSGVTDRTVWTELGYVVDGRRWWQRHEWVPLHEQVVLTTAQAPHEDAPSLRQALATVVTGLRPRRPDGQVPFALVR